MCLAAGFPGKQEPPSPTPIHLFWNDSIIETSVSADRTSNIKKAECRGPPGTHRHLLQMTLSEHTSLSLGKKGFFSKFDTNCKQDSVSFCGPRGTVSKRPGKLTAGLGIPQSSLAISGAHISMFWKTYIIHGLEKLFQECCVLFTVSIFIRKYFFLYSLPIEMNEWTVHTKTWIQTYMCDTVDKQGKSVSVVSSPAGLLIIIRLIMVAIQFNSCHNLQMWIQPNDVC